LAEQTKIDAGGKIRRGIASLLLGLAALGCSQQRTSVLFITVDTVRFDAIGCNGGPEGITPRMDALAREGILWTNARTVAPLTLPAHASMLTGLYPPRHTVRDNGQHPLPGASVSLAEAAHGAGFDTAAFVGAVVLDGSLGLAQGFDLYDQPARPLLQSSRHFAERPAGEVVAGALDWLADATSPERPFFLWVHLYDPHAPYSAPRGFRLRAEQKARPGGLPADYLAEVGFVDHAIGMLVDALEDAHRLDTTAVLVVADHGEALGDGGERTHGVLCRESTLRIPFILRPPGGTRAQKSDAVATVADVAPTLAGLMGVSLPGNLDGIDLLAAPPLGERGVYFETVHPWRAYRWSPLAGWVDGQGKFVHSGTPAFYDLASDPAEETNRIAARNVASYRRAIEQVAAAPALRPDAADGESLDPALVAGIRALGYAGAGMESEQVPHPLAETGLPAPSARIATLERLQEAAALSNGGRAEQVIPLLTGLLAEEPENPAILDHLAFALIQTERHGEALPFLQRLEAGGDRRSGTLYNLGVCLKVAGRIDEALERFAAATAADPQNPQAIAQMINTLEAAGRGDESTPWRQRLRELGQRSGQNP